MKIIRYLPNAQATRELGKQLAPVLQPGLKVYFYGELGTGKTTLVRGILQGLGYHGKVKSPSYILVELYPLSKLDLYHFDFYRFEDAKESEDAGFREYFGTRSVCLVEWPENAAAWLPAPDIKISLRLKGKGRDVTIEGATKTGRQCLAQMQEG